VRSSFREYGLTALLPAGIIVTTTANGARFMQNFLEGMPPVVRDADLWPWGWLADHPDLCISGWAFSFTLPGILLSHEFAITLPAAHTVSKQRFHGYFPLLGLAARSARSFKSDPAIPAASH